MQTGIAELELKPHATTVQVQRVRGYTGVMPFRFTPRTWWEPDRTQAACPGVCGQVREANRGIMPVISLRPRGESRHHALHLSSLQIMAINQASCRQRKHHAIAANQGVAPRHAVRAEICGVCGSGYNRALTLQYVLL